MILATAALCMALNVYMEARGEPIMGQYAVALVTMNRAKYDKAKVCEVVTKPYQFSWTTKLVRGRQLLESGLPRDADAWRTAQIIANVTLAGRMPDFTDGSNFYHATSVRPYWTLAMAKTKKVGNHVFYRYNT